MTPSEDGLPLVGPSARCLGLRRAEVTCNADDVVVTGGMSVAPASPWNLPPHRRPKRMGRASTGPNGDWVFEIVEHALTSQQLALTHDAPDHALVHGREACRFDELTERLALTRPSWTRCTQEDPP